MTWKYLILIFAVFCFGKTCSQKWAAPRRPSSSSSSSPPTFTIHAATAGNCPDCPPLDPNRPTVVLTPDAGGAALEPWIAEAARIFRSWATFNVILVDWRGGAAGDVERAGERAARLLLERGVRPRDVQFVGLGLGAHLAAHAGQFVLAATGRRLGRITALDPSPAFDYFPDDRRLSRDDADFVDVVHTDSRKLGWGRAAGHVDWYVNGGAAQPGCPVAGDFCSHRRAADLFVESLIEKVLSEPVSITFDCAGNRTFEKIPNGFRINFGQWTSLRARGVYAFETGGRAPFLIPSF